MAIKPLMQKTLGLFQNPKKRLLAILGACIGVALIFALILLIVSMSQRASLYNQARQYDREGNAEQAYQIFDGLGSYKNSEDYARRLKPSADYSRAMHLFDAGSYQEAYDIFSTLGNHQDARQMAEKCKNYIQYNIAQQFYDEGRHYEAYIIYQTLQNFEDSVQYSNNCLHAVPENQEWYRNPAYADGTVTIRYENKGDLVTVVNIYAEDETIISTFSVAGGTNFSIKVPAGAIRVGVVSYPGWFESDWYQKAEFTIVPFGEEGDVRTFKDYNSFRIREEDGAYTISY